jgi:hypothetical protein
MGRYRYGSKQEADSLKQVNVSFLKLHGFLRSYFMSGAITWSRNGKKTGAVSIQSHIDDNEQYIRFFYTETDRDTEEKKDFDYKIPLITTPCYFGGFRYWFRCPWYANGVYCGRRVGVLYLGGKYFACRHCYGLTYASRKISGFEKAFGRVISMPELDEMKDKIKRTHYAGKMTRRYKKYLDREERGFRQIMMVSKGLYATKKLEKT